MPAFVFALGWLVAAAVAPGAERFAGGPPPGPQPDSAAAAPAAPASPASPAAVATAGDTLARIAPAAAPGPAAAPDAPRWEPAGSLGEPGEPRERLVEPAGVATDAFGRVYASDAATHRIVRWDGAGRWLGEAGSLGSEANAFRRPGALARLGSLGVAVLDVENRRVVTYNLDLHLLGVLANFGGGETEAALGPVTPVGLAADRGGAVYVADADGDRVLAFDFSGRFLRALGGHGTGEGLLSGLAAIAAAPQGLLVAADRPDDRGAMRLQWFDAGGRVVRAAAAGAPVAGATRRGGAAALAVDDAGRVAVADEDAGTVELLSPAGGPLARLEGLARPAAVAFAPDGSLLVAERGAARVRRFAPRRSAPGE